jgi:hypothetical protein
VHLALCLRMANASRAARERGAHVPRLRYSYFFIIISSQAILPSAIFISCIIIILPSLPIIMIMQSPIGVADFIIASS